MYASFEYDFTGHMRRNNVASLFTTLRRLPNDVNDTRMLFKFQCWLHDINEILLFVMIETYK